MKFFNHEKSKDNSEDKVLAAEFEKNIEERRTELATLKEVLRGMRLEISSLMKEIKSGVEELEKIKDEKSKLEIELNLLNESYLQLKQRCNEKQDTILLLDKTISEIRKEIAEESNKPENYPVIKEEYDRLQKEISEEKIKLFQLKSERNLLLKNDNKIPHTKPSIKKKSVKAKICTAKTSAGSLCRRKVSPGKEFCSVHLDEKD